MLSRLIANRSVDYERVKAHALNLEIAREYGPQDAPLIDQCTLIGTYAEEGIMDS